MNGTKTSKYRSSRLGQDEEEDEAETERKAQEYREQQKKDLEAREARRK